MPLLIATSTWLFLVVVALVAGIYGTGMIITRGKLKKFSQVPTSEDSTPAGREPTVPAEAAAQDEPTVQDEPAARGGPNEQDKPAAQDEPAPPNPAPPTPAPPNSNPPGESSGSPGLAPFRTGD